MRDYFEHLETQILAPYAVKSKTSKGRVYPEPPSETRTCFQRDRDRIIHAKAFRRLKHKTQVFIAQESDHYRSRLTHTIEVAQITRHIARLLRLNEDLSESIALAHDLGHTPFGHSGERELNTLMKDYGGFEHNLQSFRIIDVLETKYPQFRGLNLSFEVKAGLLKHQTPWDTPEEINMFSSLEAQVCNLADEITYNNHDIDDGINSGILSENELETQVDIWKDAKQKVKSLYTNLKDHELLHLTISHLISVLVKDVVDYSVQMIQDSGISSIEDLQTIESPLIGFSKSIFQQNQQLRKFLYQRFYSHPTIHDMNTNGQLIIRDLFKAYNEDPSLLPSFYQELIPASSLQRAISDYIAGMTDIYAKQEHRHLKKPA